MAAASGLVTAYGAVARAELLCSFSAATAVHARAAYATHAAFLLAFALIFFLAHYFALTSGVRAALILALFSKLAPGAFLFLTLFAAAASGAEIATAANTR